MKIRFIVLILLYLSFYCVNAQVKELRVEYFEIPGQIDKLDPILEGLGRFDAYEFHLNEMDVLHTTLKGDFVPLLITFSPSGDRKLYFPEEGSSRVYTEWTVNETGTWTVYVVGDSLNTGSYLLQNYYASADSRTLTGDVDFCNALNFIIAHSNADFHFFNSPEFYENIKPAGINFFENSVSEKILGNDKSGHVFETILGKFNNFETATKDYSERMEAVEACHPAWIQNNNLPDRKTESGEILDFIKFYEDDENGIFIELLLEGKTVSDADIYLMKMTVGKPLR